MNHSARACAACGSPSLSPLIRIEKTPALMGVLWPSKAAATVAAAGELDLHFCGACGLVYNVAFDPALVDYEADYDISAHFSAVFRSYVEDLIERLSSSYTLAGKHVVEIGCGKGEFLTELCRLTAATGTGYDRSYSGESDDVQPGVVFRTEYFGPEHAGEPLDFLVCRHVLEHVPEPLDFLRGIRAIIGRRPVTCYFEMPDARFVFSDAGIWDLIYPHVSYFGPVSLRAVMERAGFDVVDIGTSFQGQYLWTVVTTDPAASARTPREVVSADAAELITQARAATSAYEQTVASWRAELSGLDHRDGDVVLWGAGSKGTSFVCAVGGDLFDTVVDVNPRKAGRYLPSSGLPVIAPEQLKGRDVARVLVANPAYREEIDKRLRELGVETLTAAI